MPSHNLGKEEDPRKRQKSWGKKAGMTTSGKDERREEPDRNYILPFEILMLPFEILMLRVTSKPVLRKMSGRKLMYIKEIKQKSRSYVRVKAGLDKC